MTIVVKTAQFIGFAVVALITLMIVFSVIVNQLPVETTVKYTVTEITPK